ncbi:hypothetical protein GCM10017556_37160 [Micromonospora sagamiensis]|nr:hypothetical protein GCM10017556_37160 [Micromonospora sagamiensis]
MRTDPLPPGATVTPQASTLAEVVRTTAPTRPPPAATDPHISPDAFPSEAGLSVYYGFHQSVGNTDSVAE